MSRKYEALIVVDTKGKEQSLQEFQDLISQDLKNAGAKLEEVKALGRKTFAYNARKLEGAQYINYFFEVDPAAIDGIKAKLALNADIYLQYYQRVN